MIIIAHCITMVSYQTDNSQQSMLIYANRIIKADFDSTVKSTIWTGRPLRALATPYVRHWETERAQEIKDLTSKGIIPLYHEFDKLEKVNGLTEEIEDQSTLR